MNQAHLALVVDQRGASLELASHGTVALSTPDGRRERVGLRALASVVLHGEVKLSTGVLRALCAHGVALAVLPLRGGGAAAGFTQQAHRHAALRHQQHRDYADPLRRLDLARLVVVAKLRAQAEVAGRHGPGEGNAFDQALLSAATATDMCALLGVEGAAASLHFERLHRRYASAKVFAFTGRSRRPPLDPPNALMSLSYRLAQERATQLALQSGLDVQLGFLHALHRDRPSLALDLIEPARACLDDWVHDLLCQRRLLTPEMFTTCGDGGVQLVKEGRAVFYPLWFSEGHAIAQAPMRALLGRLVRALRGTPPSAQGQEEA